MGSMFAYAQQVVPPPSPVVPVHLCCWLRQWSTYLSVPFIEARVSLADLDFGLREEFLAPSAERFVEWSPSYIYAPCSLLCSGSRSEAFSSLHIHIHLCQSKESFPYAYSLQSISGFDNSCSLHSHPNTAAISKVVTGIARLGKE